MLIAAVSTLLFLAAGIPAVFAIRHRRQSVQPSRLLSGLGTVSPQWVMLHRAEDR